MNKITIIQMYLDQYPLVFLSEESDLQIAVLESPCSMLQSHKKVLYFLSFHGSACNVYKCALEPISVM